MIPVVIFPPVLEVFYSPTCAPCVLELPVVAEFAKTGGARVRIVIVDEEARARAELRAVSSTLETEAVARTAASPGTVLRKAGDTYGILPYARTVASNGMVCAHWGGRLTATKARQLVEACSQSAISPARPRS
jgi:thiol-disulfide isomerase/thioredoxin